MSWRIGDFYISNGGTVAIEVFWPRPGDKKAQWMLPHPKKGEGQSILTIERIGKFLRCEIGMIRINAGASYYSCYETDDSWTYVAYIRNNGPNGGIRFELDGGGV